MSDRQGETDRQTDRQTQNAHVHHETTHDARQRHSRGSCAARTTSRRSGHFALVRASVAILARRSELRVKPCSDLLRSLISITVL